MSTPDKPESVFAAFVPEETNLPELTFRAVFLGVVEIVLKSCLSIEYFPGEFINDGILVVQEVEAQTTLL